MKFSPFRCTCGYVCITPEDQPHCRDCGKFMEHVTDEAGIQEVEKKLRVVMKRIAYGDEVNNA